MKLALSILIRLPVWFFVAVVLASFFEVVIKLCVLVSR